MTALITTTLDDLQLPIIQLDLIEDDQPTKTLYPSDSDELATILDSLDLERVEVESI